MKYFIYIYILFGVFLNADYKTLENNYVIFSVSDSGALGTGIKNGNADSSGKKALSLKGSNSDYLNDAGIPFEFFSLKFNSSIYANDNAEGYNSWPPPGKRKNSKNIPTVVKKNEQSIVATTVLQSKFEIKHIYKLDKKEILISVTIKNLSNSSASIIYSRGIDMDPVAIDTINNKGYKQGANKIPRDDIIYTVASNGDYPLSIFAKKDEKIKHRNAILKFNSRKGCRYNPNKIQDNAEEGKPLDAVIYMVFDLKKLEPDRSKTFSFSYILDSNLDKLAQRLIDKYYPKKSKVQEHSVLEPIVYKNIDNYEEVATNSFVVKPESGRNIKQDDRMHNYKIHGDNIPKGIEIRFGNKVLSSSNTTIVIPFRYNKKITYSVWRNKDFRIDDTEIVELTIDKGGEAVNNIIPIKITPKNRNITFQIDASFTNIPLDKLEESDPLPIKILADGVEISKKEYEKFELDADADGIYSNSFRRDNKTYIKLYPEYFMGIVPMLCKTKVGDVSIVVGVDEGYYPNDRGEQILTVNIGDISWWDKCKIVIRNILIVLFIIWYIFGLFKKDRFDKNRKIQKIVKLKGNGGTKSRAKVSFMKKVPWWQEFIPYMSEWIKLYGMVFIAGRSNNSVYLSKKTQGNIVEINLDPLENPNKQDKVIYAQSSIVTKTEEYKII